MNKMRRLYIFGLIGLAGIIIGFAWAEQISLSTYYPSPYGVYKQFRLYPRDDLVLGNPCSGSDEGLLSFDDSDSELYYCDGANWQTVSCPPAPSPPAAGGNWHPVGKSFPNIPVPYWSKPPYRLDLSPWVGAKRTVVLLKVKSTGIFPSYLLVKPFTETDSYVYGNHDSRNLVYSGDRQYKLMIVHTDDNGELKLQASMLSATWNVILVGYF